MAQLKQQSLWAWVHLNKWVFSSHQNITSSMSD